MANKPVAKYPIDKEKFKEMLKRRNLTVRGLERLPEFEYSAKSVERALESGYMSYGLATSLAKVFEMPTFSFMNSVTVIVSQ